MEVQRRVERQGGSSESGGSGSSYSLGEIERGISSSPIREARGRVREVDRSIAVIKRPVAAR